MDWFVPIAAKSLLIAGVTLLVLKAMSKRSAADRSWIAHLGLGAIVILPLAWLLLPQLEVPTSLISAEPVVQTAAIGDPTTTEVAPAAATFPGSDAAAPLGAADWAFWAYAVPAGIFLLLTLIALARLMVLQAKANVMVEPTWLTALARAQRRMGFKHGTALLVSDDLSSPISWGVMRPVILLSSEAADAHGEAEAIIAHELAHVARLDWVKLLLSRVTVALFWFNPLVWLLAREAHQLREEAADDAVLASNIEDTEYARLLVGIARHECRGLLIGAHGVAPAKNSLTRRVQRVLDAALARAPGGWRWATAAGFFAAGMAVPLAVLQLVPTTPVSAASLAKAEGPQSMAAEPRAIAEDTVGPRTTLPDAATLVPQDRYRSLRLAANSDHDVDKDIDHDGDGDRDREAAFELDTGSKTIAVAVDGAARAVAIADRASLDKIREARKAASAGRRSKSHNDAVAMAALGVNRAYARDMAAAGLGELDTSALIQLKALGIDRSYIGALANAGMRRLSVEDLTRMRAVGVTAHDVARYRRSAGRAPSVDEITDIKVLRIDPAEIDHDDGS